MQYPGDGCHRRRRSESAQQQIGLVAQQGHRQIETAIAQKGDATQSDGVLDRRQRPQDHRLPEEEMQQQRQIADELDITSGEES
jgi:hypothetical protein